MSSGALKLPTNTPKEVSAATSLIPYRKDDDRARYLGYLCCGFSDEEALYVLGQTKSWLEQARQESKFAELEERVPELRNELSQEYTKLDFYRNFRLILEKDHRVLCRSLGMETDPETGEPATMTPYDQQYLLRLRGVYTPQQMQILEAVALGDSGFNFAKWVSENQDTIQFSRTDTVTLGRADGETEQDND